MILSILLTPDERKYLINKSASISVYPRLIKEIASEISDHGHYIIFQ